MSDGDAGSEWDETTDVLVAGSGAGGVTGAYTAAREGLKVIMVEATERFGGTTAYSGGGGMWFPCNPVLLRAGTDDSTPKWSHFRGQGNGGAKRDRGSPYWCSDA